MWVPRPTPYATHEVAVNHRGGCVLGVGRDVDVSGSPIT